MIKLFICMLVSLAICLHAKITESEMYERCEKDVWERLKRYKIQDLFTKDGENANRI